MTHTHVYTTAPGYHIITEHPPLDTVRPFIAFPEKTFQRQFYLCIESFKMLDEMKRMLEQRNKGTVW